MKVPFARLKFPFHNDTLKSICLNVIIAVLKKQIKKTKQKKKKYEEIKSSTSSNVK